MYIPPFVCGLVIGAVAMLTILIIAVLISDKKKK